jgi:hypothetical protein
VNDLSLIEPLDELHSECLREQAITRSEFAVLQQRPAVWEREMLAVIDGWDEAT